MDSPRPADEQKAPKKPYVAPKLVRLGSVRDLTFGTSQGTKPDGGFSRVSDK
jgi:hypothetical protein